MKRIQLTVQRSKIM